MNQKEVDMTIKRFFENAAKIVPEEVIHGLPIRVDRANEKNVWLFSDGERIRV